MESMKWIWQYVRKYRLLMIGVFILIFIASGISIIYPLLGGKVIDDVVYQNKTKFAYPVTINHDYLDNYSNYLPLYLSDYVRANRAKFPVPNSGRLV